MLEVTFQCFCLTLALFSFFFPPSMPLGAVKQWQNEVVPCFACLLAHPDTCLNTVLVFMRPQDDFFNVYLQKYLT